MAQFSDDRFRWLEHMTSEKGGVSVKEAAKAFGLSVRSTATWLCRWENYYNEFRDIVQHFLTRVPGNPPIFKVGPDWWGERYNKGMGEDWHDEHDVEGINPLHVSLGFVKTRTDSITHKRTVKGSSSRKVRLEWIAEHNGVTSSALADQFSITHHAASTLLSNWKKKELVEEENRLWTVKGQKRKNLVVVQAVVGYYDINGKRRTRMEWQVVELEEGKSHMFESGQ